MKRVEIAEKFDAIVEFSGIGKFLDTPVKRYSSGMYVRLAFSVAAHMEPDILIVDEVLAVGDAEFQKKCLGKMQEVTKKDGRTILFVSHNMAAVETLCKKTIWLEGGRIRDVGETKNIIEKYLNDHPSMVGTGHHSPFTDRKDKKGLRFTGIGVAVMGGGVISSDSRLAIKLDYASDSAKTIVNPRIVVSIVDERYQIAALRLDSAISKESIGEDIPGAGSILCETGPINLKAGRYTVMLKFDSDGTNQDLMYTAAQFDVVMEVGQFGYRAMPDKDFSSHLVPFSFKSE